MNIPLIKPLVGKEELEAIEKVFETGFLTEGEATSEFERKFGEYIGVGRAVATTSASTALDLGLRVLGVGPGDEIIAPDFTFPITASVAFLVGARPVLVDIDDETYAIDPDEVKKALTPGTKVVLPVSLFGNPVDLKPLRELQEEHDFAIFEDAAGSVGAELNGKKAGSEADLACYSFHPRKIITTGEGGMLTTNDEDLADRAHSFKHFGGRNIDGKLRYVQHGTNYKLSNILAAVGLEQMKKLDPILRTRREKAAIYDDLLEGSELVRRPRVLEGAKCAYQSYTTLLLREGIRDEVIKEMKKKGIETQFGTHALSLHPAYDDVKKIGDLSVSHKAYRNTLTLPLYHDITEEEQRYVCESLNNILKTY